jgi:hypothetical protein
MSSIHTYRHVRHKLQRVCLDRAWISVIWLVNENNTKIVLTKLCESINLMLHGLIKILFGLMIGMATERNQ